VEVYLYYTVFNYSIYVILALRQSGLLQVEAVILEDCTSVPTVISPLKQPGNFMCLKISTATKYKYYITAYLCVPYDSQRKEKIFPYTAIAGSLL
jgi:hypothetical protein